MDDQLTLDLGIPTESFVRKRDFHGYAQFREPPECPWRFYVFGFDHTTSGKDGRCKVLRTDGTAEWVPIDKNDRITISGKKYGPRYWHH